MDATSHNVYFCLAAVERGGGDLSLRLAQALRASLEGGDVGPGERLPSTRALSASLGVARGTMVDVFERLIGEGWLEAASGSRTLVARDLPVASVTQTASYGSSRAAPRISARIERYTRFARSISDETTAPFAIACPIGDAAPATYGGASVEG